MKKETKYKIGVMGSAGRRRKLPKELLGKAREVGREIAENNCILITGACMGIPNEAEKGAIQKKGIIIGFSPASNLKEHIDSPVSYPKPTSQTILIFTGFGKEGRNVLTIRSCDAVIFLAGSIGTLTEFSLAYHMGKIIGVLKGTGGIAEKILDIAKNIQKDTGAVLVFDSNPKKLVKKVINILENEKS